MWETWNIVFPLPECLWAPNLVGWWLTLRSSYPWNYLGLWFRSLARSREKLKPIYLYYLNTYDHQTCQGGDLPWETPTHKSHMALWSLDLARLCDKLKPLDTATTIPMPTRFGRVVNYHERLSFRKSHDPLITWFCEIMWQTKPIISPLTQCLSTPTW